MGYAAAEIAPVVTRLREMMLASTRILADETVVPVLDPGRGRTRQGYFWAIGAGFEIALVGEIAAMVRLGLTNGTPVSANDHDLFARSVKVVAGTGFEPVTFRL
jgi:Transposase IS66 family